MAKEDHNKDINEMRISISMDSLLSTDQIPSLQSTFSRDLDLGRSLDNIILDPSISEDNLMNNEILNQSDSIINELDSLLDNSGNIYETENILNVDTEIQPHISNKLLNHMSNEFNNEVLSKLPDAEVSELQQNNAMNLSSNLTNVIESENNTFSENNQVSFKEEKGLGFIDVNNSSANLVKFFSDPAGYGSDEDGRRFFDSFTAQSSPKKDAPDGHNILSPITLESNLEPYPAMGSQDADCYLSEESIYEAWIPSDATRQILYQALVTTNAPTQFQPISNLCLPGIIIEESLGDPIYDLLKEHLGEQEAKKRLILTADRVPQDIVGLQQLIKADCLRAAVDLTNRLISGEGQGVGKVDQITMHTPYSLQLWFCRFSLLCRLQLYTATECEWEAFKNLDTPDLYFEFHQTRFPNRRGSMVPFKMRILHAEFPQYVNKHQDSVDRLCYIYAVIQQILKNLNNGLAEDGSSIEIPAAIITASKKLWLHREIELLHSLVNCYLSMKDYLAAMDIYKILLVKCPSEKEQLYSAMGRLSLQVGDIVFATKYFDFAFETSNDKSEDSMTRLIHRGMLEIGNGQFENAYTIFKQAVEKDSKNVMAINNKAVCALYMGRLKEALQLYESLISIDPSKYLLESVVLNLCTLYELEASRTNTKKLNLLRLIGQYKATGFNIACLKMS